MNLENSYALPARPEVVWAALNDPQVLSAALPGCKSLVMIDERHFLAISRPRDWSGFRKYARTCRSEFLFRSTQRGN